MHQRKALSEIARFCTLPLRRAPFLLVGIGNLAVASHLVRWGYLWVGRSTTPVGIGVSYGAIVLGLVTVLLGVWALRLCFGLSTLPRKEYAWRVLLVFELGTPSWIAATACLGWLP